MTVYAPGIDRAAYAPVQYCHAPALAEVATEDLVRHLAEGRKVARLAAFTELLAVENALCEGFGFSLAETAPWKPLRAPPLAGGRGARADTVRLRGAHRPG